MQYFFGQAVELVNELMPSVLDLRYTISYKADGSPVTKADIYLENKILELVSLRIAGCKTICEESFSGSGVQARGSLVIIDPIDGTENFCSGLKEWGVSIGVWHDGRHLGSMLHMPELGETIISGQPVSKVSRSRITGFSSSYTEAIGEGIRDAEEYRVTGCAVYNLINVIRGSFCRFVNPKGAYVWDLLPGLMLALEHGCEVILDGEPFHGQFLDPTKKYRVDIRHRYDLHSR